MRTIQFIILLAMISSCSSVNQGQSSKNYSKIAEEDDKMVGEPLPGWAEQEGSIEAGRIFEVGIAEMGLDKAEHYIKKAALMDAEVKLVSETPADFRILTQNALTGAGIDSSEFKQVQTSLREVIGLGSMKAHESTCRKIVRYLENSKKITRSCWYRASLDINELREAIKLTLARKYGIGKANQFDEVMKKELEKIDNLKRFDQKTEVKDEKQSVNASAVVSDQQ